MIEKVAEGFDVLCDGCDGGRLEIDSPEGEWCDVMSEMACNGWVSVKNHRGGWQHFCPCCKLQQTG